MINLFASLQGVSNALGAFSQALGAEQNNVSNSSTPGYAAVTPVIQPVGFGSTAGRDTVAVSYTHLSKICSGSNPSPSKPESA